MTWKSCIGTVGVEVQQRRCSTFTPNYKTTVNSLSLKPGVKPKLTFTSRTRLSSRRPISEGFSEVSVSEIVKYSRTRNFKWKEENAFIELWFSAIFFKLSFFFSFFFFQSKIIFMGCVYFLADYLDTNCRVIFCLLVCWILWGVCEIRWQMGQRPRGMWSWTRIRRHWRILNLESLINPLRFLRFLLSLSLSEKILIFMGL